MNKREMADYIRRNAVFRIHDEVATAAAAALEREADAEDKAKPKVTLKEQARVVDLMQRDTEYGLVPRARPGSTIASTMISELSAAADTLYRLDEEGGKLLAELNRLTDSGRHFECVTWKLTADLLRALGVEPKS